MKRTLLAGCIMFLLATWMVSGADDPAKAGQAAPGAKRIGVEEYDQLRTRTNVVQLDVRSSAEFAKGHIPGATNIDISSTQFSERIAALDKGKTYLVNCAVGMRSARACQKLGSIGFTNLFDLAPGFEGWKKAGKPVAK